MTETRSSEPTMTNCADFQDRLPELFESNADLSVEEHLKGCENCTALVRDLEYIAQQAKLLLPIHDPGPGVWEHIREAIHHEDDEVEGSPSQMPPAQR
jgi:predicted anti-sigma-YlaC factor YlaD